MAGGAEVLGWDDSEAGRAAATAEGVPLVDLHTLDWSTLSALCLSPGVPLTHPQPHWTVKRAQEAGVEILGDVELFARTVNACPEWKRPKVAAITGTNGKSTTTALLAHILNAAGKDARVGGNIGTGVLGLDDMHGGAVYVLELSSYQLDLTSSSRPTRQCSSTCRPTIWSGTAAWTAMSTQARIFLNQGKGDTAVIGVDDAIGQRVCTELLALNRRTITPISAVRTLGRGVYALQGVLYDATGERAVEVADLTQAKGLPGRHNQQNVAAAYAAAIALGVNAMDAVAAIDSFGGLATGWRMRAPSATCASSTTPRPPTPTPPPGMSTIPRFFWIAGGRAKSDGIAPLADLFDRVERAYLIRRGG